MINFDKCFSENQLACRRGTSSSRAGRGKKVLTVADAYQRRGLTSLSVLGAIFSRSRFNESVALWCVPSLTQRRLNHWFSGERRRDLPTQCHSMKVGLPRPAPSLWHHAFQGACEAPCRIFQDTPVAKLKIALLPARGLAMPIGSVAAVWTNG